MKNLNELINHYDNFSIGISFSFSAHKIGLSVVISQPCIAIRNTEYCGFQFLSRRQQEDETIDQYVTDLRTLMSRCEFEKLKNKDLLDRLLTFMIVMGVRDAQSQEQLLARSTLKLTEAINVCRGREVSQKQLATMNPGPTKTEQVDALYNQNKAREERCSRCNLIHRGPRCPAMGRTCNRCGGKDHFAAVCTSVRAIEEPELEDDDEHDDELDMKKLDSVFSSQVDVTEWKQEICVNGSWMTFKLDSGAVTNILPLSMYEKLMKDKPEMWHTSRRLTSYTGHKIGVVDR